MRRCPPGGSWKKKCGFRPARPCWCARGAGARSGSGTRPWRTGRKFASAGTAERSLTKPNRSEAAAGKGAPPAKGAQGASPAGGRPPSGGSKPERGQRPAEVAAGPKGAEGAPAKGAQGASPAGGRPPSGGSKPETGQRQAEVAAGPEGADRAPAADGPPPSGGSKPERSQRQAEVAAVPPTTKEPRLLRLRDVQQALVAPEPHKLQG